MTIDKDIVVFFLFVLPLGMAMWGAILFCAYQAWRGLRE